MCTQTAGVEVVVAQVPIPDTTMLAELYLLDTSGSDLYKESLASYWNGVYYAALVFDVTSQESFDSLKAWSEELKKSRPDKERPLKAVLVATKTDLPSQRHAVSLETAQDWANSNAMDFCAVSSVSLASRCRQVHAQPGRSCSQLFAEASHDCSVQHTRPVTCALVHPVQLPPGQGIEAPFTIIAKAFHKAYEEKVASYVDASRNWA